MSGSCPYCRGNRHKPSYLPATGFNQKQFSYLSCLDCKTIYVSPFPNDDDFDKMYPKEYQGGVNDAILKDNDVLPGLRFTYGQQFNLVEKLMGKGSKEMLDYGCGNGNFVVNAIFRGHLCDGIEYSHEQVNILNKEIRGSAFFTPADFEKESKLYDVIRISNVVEHLTDPHTVIEMLTVKLKPGGILLVEGPLENNFSLSWLVKKTYFRLKKRFSGKLSAHAPTHITFTNHRNQLRVFENRNIETVAYIITERSWPSPSGLKHVKGIKDFFKYLQASTSKGFSKLNKNWGNTFLYAGRKK